MFSSLCHCLIHRRVYLSTPNSLRISFRRFSRHGNWIVGVSAQLGKTAKIEREKAGGGNRKGPGLFYAKMSRRYKIVTWNDKLSR
jgi:hypothetical protein